MNTTEILVDAEIADVNALLNDGHNQHVVRDAEGTFYLLNLKFFRAFKILQIAKNAVVIEYRPFGAHEDCREAQALDYVHPAEGARIKNEYLVLIATCGKTTQVSSSE